jgi:hypothetical protein
MIEKHSYPAILTAKRQHWQVGIKRPRRSHCIFSRSDPVNRTVAQQQSAVLSNRSFLTKGKITLRLSPLRNRFGQSRPNPFLYSPAENLIALVAVYGHGTGSVVSVRGVDQQPICGDIKLPGNLFRHRIEQVPRQHQNIAGDDRQSALAWLFEYHGNCPQFSLLTGSTPGENASADNHAVIGLQCYCRSTNQYPLGRGIFLLTADRKYSQPAPVSYTHLTLPTTPYV